MIFRAYCVGKVHNMLPQKLYDISSVLCRYGTQYATLVVLWLCEHLVKVGYPICYLGSILIMGAYCVGKVHNMLPW